MVRTPRLGVRTIFRGLRSQHGDWTAIQFFMVAVAYKVPWTAISSLLGQLSKQFDEPKVLLYLNLAYFVPSVPALLVHSSLQDALERSFGVPKAALLRFTVGLGGLAVLCLVLPLCCSSLHLLLTATAAVGVCYSIAFGTSHQLSPRFPASCTVALTTGFVSCGVVVLLADLLLKQQMPYYTPAAMVHLFQLMAVQTCIGLLAAAAMLGKHWQRLADTAVRHSTAAGRAADSSSSTINDWIGTRVPVESHIGLGLRHQQQHTDAGIVQQGHKYLVQSDAQQIISSVAGIRSSTRNSENSSNGPSVCIHLPATAARSHYSSLLQHKKPADQGASSFMWWLYKHIRAAKGLDAVLQLLSLAGCIWPAALGISLSVGSSMLVFPFFTYVPHTGAFGEALPQVLFYARLLGDMFGRLMPPCLQLKSSKAVLSAAACKVLLLLVLLPALLQPGVVGGDTSLAALIAISWWMSGYINTGAYLLAPKLVSRHSKTQLLGDAEEHDKHGSVDGSDARAKAGGLMTVCFQTACFIGLLLAWLLQALVLEGWSPHTHTAVAGWQSGQDRADADIAATGMVDAAVAAATAVPTSAFAGLSSSIAGVQLTGAAGVTQK